MSLASPIDFDAASLRRHVTEMYERGATAPDDAFHFNVAGDYAVHCPGYDRNGESLPV